MGAGCEFTGFLDARMRKALPPMMCLLSLGKSQLIWADSLHLNLEWSGGVAGTLLVHLFHMAESLILSIVLSCATEPAVCFPWFLPPEPTYLQLLSD